MRQRNTSGYTLTVMAASGHFEVGPDEVVDFDEPLGGFTADLDDEPLADLDDDLDDVDQSSPEMEA